MKHLNLEKLLPNLKFLHLSFENSNHDFRAISKIRTLKGVFFDYMPSPQSLLQLDHSMSLEIVHANTDNEIYTRLTDCNMAKHVDWTKGDRRTTVRWDLSRSLRRLDKSIYDRVEHVRLNIVELKFDTKSYFKYKMPQVQTLTLDKSMSFTIDDFNFEMMPNLQMVNLWSIDENASDRYDDIFSRNGQLKLFLRRSLRDGVFSKILFKQCHWLNADDDVHEFDFSQR